MGKILLLKIHGRKRKDEREKKLHKLSAESGQSGRQAEIF